MKLFALTVALFATMGGGTSTAAENIRVDCPGNLKAVNFYREATWNRQKEIQLSPTRSVWRPSTVKSCRYAAWVAKLWQKRATNVRSLQERLAQPLVAIRFVFGPYGEAENAIRVASCETGGTFSVWSENGQYENIFQMGLSERRRFGWHTVGSHPIVAARAALAYWKVSGWHPWQCHPSGGLRW